MPTRDELILYLYDVADRYGIRRDIAYAQIQKESNFNPNATSPAGAQGIAQFMPATAARYGLSNPYDPYASLEAWGLYMSDLLTMFGWRYDLALAGYNSGENRAEYLAAYQQNRPINWSALPPGVQSQTQNYVTTIMAKAGALTPAIIDPAVQYPSNPQPNGSDNTLLWVLGIGASLIVLSEIFDN